MTTLATLQALIAREHKIEPESIGPESTLESLGIDSLATVELIFDLEDAFGIKVGTDRTDLRTVGDVATYVDRLVAEQRGSASVPSA